MSKDRLLLIEDQEDLAVLIKMQAEILKYKLVVETDGINGFKALQRERPDLVILDILLPGQNGFDVLRKIKTSPELKQTPVIILSGKNEEIDMLLGLELGADDYVTKPFSVKVLFSRIKTILKRREASIEKTKKSLTFGNFILDVERYLLKKGGQEITLTLSELGILKRLLSNKGKVLTRNQLLNDINNDESFVVDRNIDVHIASLRKKLGPDFNYIETVRGIGYRFKEMALNN